MTVDELASLIDGEVFGQRNIKINGFNNLDEALENEVSFLFSDDDMRKIEKSKSKIIISKPLFFLNQQKTFIFTLKSFEEILYLIVEYFNNNNQNRNEIISEKSNIASNVSLGKNVIIKSGAVIEEDVTIGDNSIINQNVIVKKGSLIGKNTIIDCGACIGAESFWGVQLSGINHQIKGLKGVNIGNNVYIGANSTIEKGVLRATKIGDNTKIGSLVTIAHDTVIGNNTRIVSQTGIASQCNIGDNVLLYGQVGIKDKINIGNNVTIYAKSGIRENIKDDEKISGIPGIKHKDNIKMLVKNRREFLKDGKK